MAPGGDPFVMGRLGRRGQGGSGHESSKKFRSREGWANGFHFQQINELRMVCHRTIGAPPLASYFRRQASPGGAAGTGFAGQKLFLTNWLGNQSQQKKSRVIARPKKESGEVAKCFPPRAFQKNDRLVSRRPGALQPICRELWLTTPKVYPDRSRHECCGQSPGQRKKATGRL